MTDAGRIVFLLTAFLLRLTAFTQTTGTLTGYVTGGTVNDTIAGAAIQAGGKVALTGVNGMYRLVLPAGEHAVRVSMPGFESRTQLVLLMEGVALTVNFELEESLNPLEEVVVSAERYSQRLGEVVVSMEVIKPALLQNKNTTSFDQVMNQVPGVQVNDGQASIRGGSGFSYGAGSRVLLLVDGIPMISADAGDIKWNFLPIENLEQVEVIKGASSVLYGTGALNGVINFRTAYARRQPRTEVQLFHGRYDAPRNTYKWWKGSSQSQQGINFSHSQKTGDVDIVLGAHKFSDEGFRMLETESRDRVNASLRYSPRQVPGLSAGINTNLMNVRGGLFFLWQHYDSAYIPQGRVIQNYDNKRFYIDPWVSYSSGSDSGGGYQVNFRNRYFKTDNQNDKEQGSYAELYYSELQVTRRMRNGLNLTAGFVHMQQMIFGDSIYGRHTGRNTAAYVQAVHRFRDRLTVSVGVRGEHYAVDTMRTKGYLNNHGGGPELPFQPVVRAGISYQLRPFSYLRASFGQGYRFPSVAEKFVTTKVSALNIFPNPELNPERAYNAEVSLKQGFRVGNFRGYADLTGFYTRYYDMIEFVFDIYRPGGATGLLFQDLAWAGFKSQNVGEAEITGGELSVSGNGKIAGINITTIAGLTVIRPLQKNFDPARDTLGLPGIQTLKYRSATVGKADVQLDYRRFSAGYSARYQSRIENIDRRFVQSVLHEYHNPAIGVNTIDGPFILPGMRENFDAFSKDVVIQDVRFSFQLTEMLRLSFIVNNIGNVEYQSRPGDMRAPRMFLGQLLLKI